MKCLNCGDEMVDAELGVDTPGAETPGTMVAWPRGTSERGPWYKLGSLSPAVHTAVGRPTKACPQRGLLLLFVEDPSLFRPK